jgi:hypothetical protein
MALETTTETTRTGANSTQTKHEVYVPDGQGRRRLLETSQTDVQTLGAGSSRSVTDSFTPDLNGRLNVSGRQVEEIKTPSANVRQTDVHDLRSRNQSATPGKRTSAEDRD